MREPKNFTSVSLLVIVYRAIAPQNAGRVFFPMDPREQNLYRTSQKLYLLHSVNLQIKHKTKSMSISLFYPIPIR